MSFMIQSLITLFKVTNAPAATGICTDPDPNAVGEGNYVCPAGYLAKEGVETRECTSVATCNANCCQAHGKVHIPCAMAVCRVTTILGNASREEPFWRKRIRHLDLFNLALRILRQNCQSPNSKCDSLPGALAAHLRQNCTDIPEVTKIRIASCHVLFCFSAQSSKPTPDSRIVPKSSKWLRAPSQRGAHKG